MNPIIKKTDDAMAVGAAIGCFPILCVIAGLMALFGALFSTDPDPMDHSINKSQRIVEMLDVKDSTGNGFRVHYATAYAVTNERYDEIFARPSLRDAYRRLQHDAPLHFGGSLLETDIYDFAAYARTYDISSDVCIDCIFVIGPEKTALYAQPNPALPDGATSINPATRQGTQWIGHDDVYFRKGVEDRLYRYYKCPGMRGYSSTDERFVHFTQSEN